MKRGNKKPTGTHPSDTEWLNNPDLWPNIVAPVKRHEDRDLVCGVVCAGQPTVRLLNMHRGWTPEEFNAARKWEYDSMEALVDDGWQVD